MMYFGATIVLFSLAKYKFTNVRMKQNHIWNILISKEQQNFIASHIIKIIAVKFVKNKRILGTLKKNTLYKKETISFHFPIRSDY